MKKPEDQLNKLELLYSLENYEFFSQRNIKIVNKKGDLVPFSHNSIQKQINSKIDELRSQGILVRLLILKARQEGVTTNEQGRMLFNTTTKPNRNALVVAHRNDSTGDIFEKSKFMFDHLPNDAKPYRKASNATELVFDLPSSYSGKGKGLNSRIQIQTAGSGGVGRSNTIHYVHASEFAFWEGRDDKSPIKQLNGILQAVPDDLDTEVVIESTANGFNDFKDLWDDSVSGKTAFIPLFFSWFVHEEYQMELSEDEKETFIYTFSDYENWLYKDLKLPLERIRWWRHTLKNKCNGDLNMMKQENPSTPEEAFLMSGSAVFDNEIIKRRIEWLRKNIKPTEGVMVFEWNDPESKDFIKDPSIKFLKGKGYIRVYHLPKPGCHYVIGGDTKGEGSDFFTFTVIENETGIRCATLQANIGPDTYTHQLYCVGMWYNYALIGVEINFDLYPMKELQRLRYKKQYTRQVFDSKQRNLQEKWGWRTDGNTRTLIISNEIVLLRDNIELFFDIPFLMECLTFVYDINMRPDALSGKHDDVLFSDMIGNQIRGQQKTGTVQEKTVIRGIYHRNELKMKGYKDHEINRLVKNGFIRLIGK
jgi:hypothetical protein